MKPTKKNIKAFKALVERYETITLEELKKLSEDYWDVPRMVTGFGDYSTCTLCVTAGTRSYHNNCEKCVYGSDRACLRGKNKRTYDAISSALTPVTVRNAYRKRAEHLRKTYPQYLTE